MQGSKYVQSDTAFSFRQAKDVLDSGRFVLYSGTPCQIAGLRAFLGREYDQLLTVDIVCHGVASPGAFRKYIEFLEKEEGKKVKSYRFRNRSQYDRAGFITKTVYVSSDGTEKTVWKHRSKDVYLSYYLDGGVFRKSCYSCPYANGERFSDITIGDCNTAKLYPDFHPTEPVLIILQNSSKGNVFWEGVAELFDSIWLDVSKELAGNGQLHKASALLPDRDMLYEMFAKGDFRALALELKQEIPTMKKMWYWAEFHVPLRYRKKLGRFIKKIKGK